MEHQHQSNFQINRKKKSRPDLRTIFKRKSKERSNSSRKKPIMLKPKFTITNKINNSLLQIERARGFLDVAKLKEKRTATRDLTDLVNSSSIPHTCQPYLAIASGSTFPTKKP